VTTKPRIAVFVVVLCIFAMAALALAAAAPQKDPSAPAKDRAAQASHRERGLASFEQGFYELLPKGRRADAEVAFDTAVRELTQAVSADPSDREAHRTLGRVYTLRQDHLRAAAHYRRMTEIDPYDVDAYALAASALAEAGSFGEARTELERAKGRTSDPRTTALLDGYLAKLAEAEKQAGAGR
jgi:tetratricopeptide (TPR) repeat protein